MNTKFLAIKKSKLGLHLPLLSHWSGDVVHTYLGFASEDGKEVSNSLYLGQITVGDIGGGTNLVDLNARNKTF